VQSAAPQDRSALIRDREKWFHDRRAYPFQIIPSGALQQAIQQRDQMRSVQSSGTLSSTPGLITFPGDGLWHLAGPQPTNVPFEVARSAQTPAIPPLPGA